MNKKILKILIMFFMIVICINFMSNIAFAKVTVPPEKPPKGTGWNVTNFDGFDGVSVADQQITSSTQNIMGTIINTIRIVGTGIAIIMIIYVAIKYMSAAPTEKAEFKKSATAYIVGAIVLFASTNILAVIANFADKNI